MTGPIEQLLTDLTSARIRYLVVGGVAVVLHGYLRATADLDIVIDLEQENVGRAVAFLQKKGFRPRAPVALEKFADPEVRRQWIEEKNLQVFSLWHPDVAGFEVDVFVAEPFPFTDAYARASEARVGDTNVRVAALDDLIAMKRAAGRSRDLEDVEALLRLKAEHGQET